MTFAFNSKETYLAFRAEWTLRYLNHLKVVRAAKLSIREANRIYSKDCKCIGDIWDAYRNLHAAQRTTRELLEERAASRVEAGRQMHRLETDV